MKTTTSRSKLHALRIDSHTVILVTKDKCNKAYAEKWKERYIEDSTRPLRDQQAISRAVGLATRKRHEK